MPATKKEALVNAEIEILHERVNPALIRLRGIASFVPQ